MLRKSLKAIIGVTIFTIFYYFSGSEEFSEDELSSNTYFKFDPVIESIKFEEDTAVFNRYSISKDGTLQVSDGSIVAYSKVDGVIYLKASPFLDSKSRIFNVSEDYRQLQHDDATYSALSLISNFEGERYFANAETDLELFSEGVEEFYYFLRPSELSGFQLEINRIDYNNQVFVKDEFFGLDQECNITEFFIRCFFKIDAISLRGVSLSAVTEGDGYVALHLNNIYFNDDPEPEDYDYYQFKLSSALKKMPSMDGLLKVPPRVLTGREWQALIARIAEEEARIAEEEARIAEELAIELEKNRKLEEEEASKRKRIEENLDVCLDGRYPPLCNRELLTSAQLARVDIAEKEFIEQERSKRIEKERIEQEQRDKAETEFRENYKPLVAIAPQYPESAAREGIQGWCLVSFTVNELGNVEADTITIVNAEPAITFDRSSIRAAARFKFQPRVVDGKGVAVSDVQYLFQYDLPIDKKAESIGNLNHELKLESAKNSVQDVELSEDITDYVPLVAIAPIYPTQAARRGIEGWCLVNFTVDSLGNVIEETIIVIDAEPANIFNVSSEQAAAGFKFQPRRINGKGVEVDNVQYLFRYELYD
jgi:TonB family protein